jgi:DNA-directed RNA polymerase
MFLDTQHSSEAIDGTIIPFDPTTHPLWEEQVALEKGMTREGAHRVQDATLKAIAKGQRTKLDPYRDLLQAWIPKVADDLKQWVAQQSRAYRDAALTPAALDGLKDCDPYVAALIGLRTILDGLGAKAPLTAIATSLGGDIEHELMICLWEASEPALFRAQQTKLQLQHADHVHTQRVNIFAFNSLMAAGKFGFEWEPWDYSKRLHVGAALLDSIIRATGWFETTQEEASGKLQAPIHLTLKPGMEEWVADRLSKLEECSPALTPTVMPPKRWTGMHDGGYWTPYVSAPHLFNLRAVHQDGRSNVAAEFDALEMPKVYAALHFLQETPWRINQGVYAVVNEAQRRNLSISGIPAFRPEELPPELSFMAERRIKHQLGHKSPAPLTPQQEEALKRWKREASGIRGRNALLVSKQLSFNRTMLIAHQYQGFPRFYFPHMLDFRGRMYPIPVSLQPQGNDLARGLLQFAEGKPVGEEGGRWLAINLTSAWGMDKVSFDERVAWVEANRDMWLSIALDPMTDLEWTTADKPWQALAAIKDYVGYLLEGPSYVSHAVVAVDGTCNGLQHLASLSRDEVVGERVNLVPQSKPNDIYQYVADTCLPELKRISKARTEEGRHAKFWLKQCDPKTGKLPRKLVKRPVMIRSYSGTLQAFMNYVREELDARDPMLPRDKRPEGYLSTRAKRVAWFARQLWDAVTAALPREMEVMRWLQDCAAATAVGNQPLYWVTQDGFVCRHFYGKMHSYRVRVRLDGSVFRLRLEEPTKDLDKARQLRGISPNFVHSLDAAAARGCINKAGSSGVISAFASVHDSFGTHAADIGLLNGFLREAFVELHSGDILAGFRNACLSVLTAYIIAEEQLDPLEASQIADERLPPVPEVGALDIRGVLESDYFFA